jgi:hypothetical protein
VQIAEFEDCRTESAELFSQGVRGQWMFASDFQRRLGDDFAGGSVSGGRSDPNICASHGCDVDIQRHATVCVRAFKGGTKPLVQPRVVCLPDLQPRVQLRNVNAVAIKRQFDNTTVNDAGLYFVVAENFLDAAALFSVLLSVAFEHNAIACR